jgi:hypothetical protein
VGGLANVEWTWRVKGPKYLANAGSVTLTGAPETNVEMGLMQAGDANGDNLVNTADFNIVKASYGRGAGEPGYDDRADVDGNSLVDLIDFNFLKLNFGQGGAPPIGPAIRAPDRHQP